jgi:hypothetical protein
MGMWFLMLVTARAGWKGFVGEEEGCGVGVAAWFGVDIVGSGIDMIVGRERNRKKKYRVTEG